MLAKQGGHCAICPRAPTTTRLHVDHDHKSGLVRGLLCFRCNHLLLGKGREDPDLHEAAAAYLRFPPSGGAIGCVFVPPKPKRKRKRRTKSGIK